MKVDGRIVRKTLLQLVVESMIREAASGASAMVALFDQIHAKVIRPRKLEGGLLLPGGTVAGRVHREEEARNANAQEPRNLR